MDPEDSLADERGSERAVRRFIFLLLGSVPLVYFGLTAVVLGHLPTLTVVAGLLAVLGPYVALLNVWGMGPDARVEFGMLCGVLFVQATALGGALSLVFGLPTPDALGNPLVRFFAAIVVASLGAVVLVALSHGLLLLRWSLRSPRVDDPAEEVPGDSD